MHILVGALAGALFAVIVTVGMSLITGRRPTLKQVLLAGLGGAIGGAIGAATLGVGGMAGATIARQAVAYTAGGAAGGATEQVAENVLEGRPLHEGVGRATAVGGATGLVSLGVSRGSTALFSKVAPRLFAPVEGRATLPHRVLASPTPGTGSGWISWWDRMAERHERELAAAAERAALERTEQTGPPGRGFVDIFAQETTLAR